MIKLYILIFLTTYYQKLFGIKKMHSDILWQVCNFGGKLFLFQCVTCMVSSHGWTMGQTDEGYSFNF